MATDTVRVADKETIDKIYDAVTSNTSQSAFMAQPYYTDLNMFGKDGPAYNDTEVMTQLFNDVRSCNNEVIAPFLYDFGIENGLHMGKFFKRIEGLENMTELDNLSTLEDIVLNADVVNAIRSNEFALAIDPSLGELDGVANTNFANMSYSDMQKMLDMHYSGEINIANYWKVGDTRSVEFGDMTTVTGIDETHSAHSQNVTIIGLNHDTLTASGTSAVTIQLKNSLPTIGKMNTTSTNTTSWGDCPRRTWCNSIFYNALPTDLKSMVKEVLKRTSAGNKSTASRSTYDYCFLLSEREVFGVTTWSVANEIGTQYDYYKTEANRIKYRGDTTSVHYWWGRSPYYNDAYQFCTVGSSGIAQINDASVARGISPAFCL